jgi:enoyl-CoA hydratase
MKTPSFGTIRLILDDDTGWLELNSPPSNKMTMEFFREFAAALDFISNHKEFRALVIYGHGRHYSSGTDLPTLLEEINKNAGTDINGNLTEVPEFLSNNYRSLLLLESFRIPVISAIRGVCLGSALELALFSHFRLCGEDSVIGLPEASFNLVPGLGGIYKLCCIAGEVTALERVLKGSTFNAEDAFRYRIVDRIVPKRKLLEQAGEFAREVMNDFRIEKKNLYVKQFLR